MPYNRTYCYPAVHKACKRLALDEVEQLRAMTADGIQSSANAYVVQLYIRQMEGG